MILLTQLCLAYLLGAIPTGLVMGRLFKGVDVREHGSGNVGATNVARVAGKLPGLIVLVVDAAKGGLPVFFLPSPLSPQWLPVTLGMAAVAGHIWNPFLQFQGGKGVATSLGVLLGLDWRVGLCSAVVWGLAAFFTRYVSVASTAAALAAPFLILFWGHPTSWVLGGIAVSLAIIARHRSNYLRLLQREEQHIGSSARKGS